MTRDDTLRVVHGMRLLLPPTWEDLSIYRFAAPASEADADPQGGAKRLRPTLMVSRHEQRPGDSAGRFLELTNQDSKRQDASFEVLREGSALYLDQQATWQDACFTDASTQQVVHQRRVVVVTWPRHFTLLTLTGTWAAIEQVSAQLGLEHLSAQPGGVHTGGVSAVLVSGKPGAR